MNNVIEVKLNIDASNPKQLAHLMTMLSVIGSSFAQQTTETTESDLTVKPVGIEPVPFTAPPNSTTQVSPKPVVPKVTPKAEPVKLPEPNQVDETPEAPIAQQETGSKITLQQLRDLLGEKIAKAANNRDVCKAKLTELGSANLTTLQESKFQDFYNFLKAL